MAFAKWKRVAAALAAVATLAACGRGNDEAAGANKVAAAPEPLPSPQELAADAELANQAAEAEAVDAEVGGNNSGADAHLQ